MLLYRINDQLEMMNWTVISILLENGCGIWEWQFVHIIGFAGDWYQFHVISNNDFPIMNTSFKSFFKNLSAVRYILVSNTGVCKDLESFRS